LDTPVAGGSAELPRAEMTLFADFSSDLTG